MPRRHDADAGGPRELLATKAALRERIWRALEVQGAARFPGAGGRIPNFVGAEAAAERLRETLAWRRAPALKANPDSPQLPVRVRALEDGKRVYMAVPRLAGRKPFLLLDPEELRARGSAFERADRSRPAQRGEAERSRVSPRRAASIGGAARAGRLVDVDALEPLGLVVCGCVAVDESGARLGKGGGFSDLEYALACEAGLIGPETVVATTVHELQVLEAGAIPVAAHDFRLDLIVTPDRVIRCRRAVRARGPRGAVRFEILTPEKIAAIPVLARLARERGGA